MARVNVRCLARLIRSTCGADLVEFALVVPAFMIVLGGIVDVGLLMNQYTVVTNAAREGARVAAIPGWLEGDVKARVNTYIESAGMSTASVTTTVTPVSLTVGAHNVNAVRVLVAYPYNYLMLRPVIQTFIQGGDIANVTLKAAATMRIEVAAGL